LLVVLLQAPVQLLLCGEGGLLDGVDVVGIGGSGEDGLHGVDDGSVAGLCGSVNTLTDAGGYILDGGVI
jgi:hypothetical protein